MDHQEHNPDFSSDLFLIGAWACDVVELNRKPAHEEARYALDLGDRWLRVNYALTPGEPDRQPTSTTAFETYDPALKKWVYVSVSSDGIYGISYSDGWKGSVKVYRPQDSDPQTFRLTATRLSDTEFTEAVEVLSGAQWSTTFKLRCRRAE